VVLDRLVNLVGLVALVGLAGLVRLVAHGTGGACGTTVVGLGETSGPCGISGSWLMGLAGLVRILDLMELLVKGLVELQYSSGTYRD
jgi:hypothetical protein